MKNPLTGKKHYKTTFTAGWTEEKIANAMWEVYEKGLGYINNENNYLIKKIENLYVTVIPKLTDTNTYLVTCLPYIPEGIIL